MNTFFLHVGLHKTATTSLQAALFPNISGVNYIGRYAEGPICGDPLYYRIVKYTFSPNLPTEKDQKFLKHIIFSRLQKEALLLSDEWFTSDYDQLFGLKSCSWQEKMYRLGSLLRDVPVKVLVTTREPVEAVYSMYCEMKQEKQLKGCEGLFHYVVSDNSALAYRKKYLEDLIWILFEKKPDYLDFNDIKQNNYYGKLSDFFGIDVSAKIQERNAKVRRSDGVEIVAETYGYQLIRYFWLRLPVNIRSMVGRRFFSAFRTSLRAKFSEKKVIPRPDEQELQIVKKFLGNG